MKSMRVTAIMSVRAERRLDLAEWTTWDFTASCMYEVCKTYQLRLKLTNVKKNLTNVKRKTHEWQWSEKIMLYFN